MELFDTTFNAIEKSLDLHCKRHSLLSSNVANSETPNYRARELDFAGELSRALKQDASPLEKTDTRHLDISSSEQSHTVLDNTGAMGANGNNVDLDIEMGKLSSNARSYSDMATFLSIKLRRLSDAIRSGSGG